MANTLGTATIVIPNYSNSNRTPGVFLGVDPSNANTATPLQKTLLIGQMLSSGTATPMIPLPAQSQAQVNAACGAGSMLANMYAAYVNDDNFGAITLLPLADASGAVASVQTISVTGPATSAGTVALYVCGVACPVAVPSGTTANTIATAIASAINANANLPCTAVATTNSVAITARNKGLSAADVDIRFNYRGPLAGEVMPAGVSVSTPSLTTAGTTDPTTDLATALNSNLGDQSYQYIVTPYPQAAQLAIVQAMLSDTTGAWSPLTNTGGGAFSAYKPANLSTLLTYGAANNLQHISVLGIADTPTPVYQVAASYGAVCAASLRVDPALPLKEIVMQSVLAPPVQSRYTRDIRNQMLHAGLATSKVDSGNNVILERAVTTYQKNTLGNVDDSYLQVETLYTIQAVIDLWRAAFTSKYARVKLVDDGTTIVPGANMVNPASIKSEVIAQYQVAGNAGLVQNAAYFNSHVNVQKVSPYQVNVYAPIVLADQLFVIGVDLAFSK